MSQSGLLNDIKGAISGHSEDLEGKIEKLKAAKKDIEKEHEEGIVQIRQILNPHLDKQWTGEFATDFDEERDVAHTKMHDIVNEKYLDYISTIESKINSLKIDKGFFDGLGVLAAGADALVEKGEEAADKLNNKIDYLKSELGKRFS
ncbi:DUF5082 domain-containing protein [Bacillus sp. WMMC1349]|uniref:DUF5082 domain-containing protein n=1 Tax=Bacillus sp. WMMC1349 TaxID=2736254 RepID=UPI0015575300|nr:DUF5082 domain-containing protein [Bacillus sp. WMMC1349]NPC94185.1 DUF5082 domain-containing protein [Bacillus sp. WMMC1349]